MNLPLPGLQHPPLQPFLPGQPPGLSCDSAPGALLEWRSRREAAEGRAGAAAALSPDQPWLLPLQTQSLCPHSSAGSLGVHKAQSLEKFSWAFMEVLAQ